MNKLNQVLVSDRELETLKEGSVILSSQVLAGKLEGDGLRVWLKDIAAVLEDICDSSRQLGRDFQTR